MELYTLEDWKRDHTLSVKVGQAISNEVFYDLLGCVPPLTIDDTWFQVGEVYSIDKDGFFTYTTFKKEKDLWVYQGHLKSIYEPEKHKYQ